MASTKTKFKGASMKTPLLSFLLLLTSVVVFAQNSAKVGGAHGEPVRVSA
jgi:hypothetical protein